MKNQTHYLAIILHILGILMFCIRIAFSCILGIYGIISGIISGFLSWLGFAITATIINILYAISQSLYKIADNKSYVTDDNFNDKPGLDEEIWL